MKSVHISVHNVALPVLVFNSLCDKLSAARKWCHDYRMVADFRDRKESRYWCSYSYPEHDQKIIAAALSSIVDDTEDFLIKGGYPMYSVNITVNPDAE